MTEMLHMLNPYIELYQTANETLRNNAPANNNLQIILNPQMRLIMEAGADRCCKNLPTSNEIATIIINEYDNPCKRDIILTERVNSVDGTSMKRISQNHTAYMPLHYILLFVRTAAYTVPNRGMAYAVQCTSSLVSDAYQSDPLAL